MNGRVCLIYANVFKPTGKGIFDETISQDSFIFLADIFFVCGIDGGKGR
jgi:hypothetical protein